LGFKSQFEHFWGVIQLFKDSIRQLMIGIRFDLVFFAIRFGPRDSTAESLLVVTHQSFSVFSCFTCENEGIGKVAAKPASLKFHCDISGRPEAREIFCYFCQATGANSRCGQSDHRVHAASLFHRDPWLSEVHDTCG